MALQGDALSERLCSMRSRLKKISTTVFWLTTVPSLIWLAACIQFFFTQPAAVQRALFGRKVVGITALVAAQDQCCTITGDGRSEWVYKIESDLARDLMTRCADPLGVTWSSNAGCTVAEKNFPGEPVGINGGLSARLRGDRLTIAVDRL